MDPNTPLGFVCSRIHTFFTSIPTVENHNNVHQHHSREPSTVVGKLKAIADTYTMCDSDNYQYGRLQTLPRTNPSSPTYLTTVSTPVQVGHEQQGVDIKAESDLGVRTAHLEREHNELQNGVIELQNGVNGLQNDVIELRNVFKEMQNQMADMHGMMNAMMQQFSFLTQLTIDNDVNVNKNNNQVLYQEAKTTSKRSPLTQPEQLLSTARQQSQDVRELDAIQQQYSVMSPEKSLLYNNNIISAEFMGELSSADEEIHFQSADTSQSERLCNQTQQQRDISEQRAKVNTKVQHEDMDCEEPPVVTEEEEVKPVPEHTDYFVENVAEDCSLCKLNNLKLQNNFNFISYATIICDKPLQSISTKWLSNQQPIRVIRVYHKVRKKMHLLQTPSSPCSQERNLYPEPLLYLTKIFMEDVNLLFITSDQSILNESATVAIYHKKLIPRSFADALYRRMMKLLPKTQRYYQDICEERERLGARHISCYFEREER
jgi:hypothetical protein